MKHRKEITEQGELLTYLAKEAVKKRLVLPCLEPADVYGNLCYSPIPDDEVEIWLDILPDFFPDEECCGHSVDYMPVEVHLYMEAGLGGVHVIDYVIRTNLRHMLKPQGLRIETRRDGSLRARSTPSFERDTGVAVDVALKGRPLPPALSVALTRRKRLWHLGPPTMRTPKLPRVVLQEVDN